MGPRQEALVMANVYPVRANGGDNMARWAIGVPLGMPTDAWKSGMAEAAEANEVESGFDEELVAQAK